MSDSIQIRRLRLDEVELAEETIRVLKRRCESPGELPVDAAGMQAWLSRSSNILIAATIDGVPVGFALGYLLDRVDACRSMLFLYEIEVAKPCRRRGIGRRLVEAMKAVAREKDVLKMWVQTDLGNAAARALYRAAGGVADSDLELLYVWTERTFEDLTGPFFRAG